MDTLRIEPLAFPKASLLRWEEGQYQMLSRLGASSFVRRIIEEKLGNRHKPGRRFFGEAFVTTHVPHQHSYYGSFKWLTSWPARTSGF